MSSDADEFEDQAWQLVNAALDCKDPEEIEMYLAVSRGFGKDARRARQREAQEARDREVAEAAATAERQRLTAERKARQLEARRAEEAAAKVADARRAEERREEKRRADRAERAEERREEAARARAAEGRRTEERRAEERRAEERRAEGARVRARQDEERQAEATRATAARRAEEGRATAARRDREEEERRLARLRATRPVVVREAPPRHPKASAVQPSPSEASTASQRPAIDLYDDLYGLVAQPAPSATREVPQSAPAYTGADLLAYRRRRGLTQRLLAVQMGVAQSTIAKAELAPTELLGPALREALFNATRFDISTK